MILFQNWKKIFFIFIVGALGIFGFSYTKAAPEIREGSIIRDSEIEAILHEITEPIFKEAGLDPKSLNLYLVASADVNAAASLENSIFVNTGLLSKTTNLDELIGVLAHETGHLALGHVARFEESIRRSSLIAMASAALGIAAGLAGSSDAALGTMMAGQHVATQSLMHYSQGQEASADQAAVRFLKGLNWPTKGLENFMSYLAKQELWSVARQDAYLQTHPLSNTRVQLLKNNIASLPSKENTVPSSLYHRFQRMVIKVKAFTSSPISILMSHPPSKNSPLDRYARAIAYYRNNDLQKSLEVLDSLIKEAPDDPYLYDLKGQILFDNGHLQESIKSYETALKFAPQSALIRLSYIQAILEKGAASLPDTLRNLKIVLQKEKKNPLAWHFLAVVYGQMNRNDLAALALAEKALTLDNLEDAEKEANRALHLTKDSSARIRAKDILEYVHSEK